MCTQSLYIYMQRITVVTKCESQTRKATLHVMLSKKKRTQENSTFSHLFAATYKTMDFRFMLNVLRCWTSYILVRKQKHSTTHENTEKMPVPLVTS